jgi:four helix bundle protein
MLSPIVLHSRRILDFVDQIRRATVSIMSNIAEGFERSGSGEFVHFLAVAKGSAGEVVSHLYVAADQGYLGQGEFQRLSKLAIDTGRVIGGLMICLRKSDLKDPKYKSSIR